MQSKKLVLKNICIALVTSVRIWSEICNDVKTLDFGMEVFFFFFFLTASPVWGMEEGEHESTPKSEAKTAHQINFP